jgi:hypothetical protein
MATVSKEMLQKHKQPMTHDELLASIERMTNHDAIFMKDALRAVVELHQVAKFNGGRNHGLNKRCTECGFHYPCPTIEAIEKELG